MAGAKEIRGKIKSIQSTQKITRAMEMVAASKMRKAQDLMKKSRPYAHRIKDVIHHVSQGRLEYQHPYLIERDVKNAGFIIVSTDRGLCGGLNINLFKKVLTHMRELKEKGVKTHLVTIGKKAEAFFSRIGANIAGTVTALGDEPKPSALVGAVKVMLDLYDKEELDQVNIAYNDFINTMVQQPIVESLLPIVDTELQDKDNNLSWDYIYEPHAEDLLEALIQRYIESLVYQGVVENNASEQAARMVAMKSASDNAGDLIQEFQLIYNKARQASITQELSEIVAGAAAV